MTRPRTRLPVREAFTLIELLVVIAIIGVLVGMLLPAVQHVRATTARTQCANNLKQIALASQNYEAAVGRLPPGWNSQSQVGTLAYLLPYVEQNNLYNQMPADAFTNGPATPWWVWRYSDGGAWAAACTRVKTFECPSANAYSAPNALLYYQATSNGFFGTYESPALTTLGATNYLSSAGGMGPASLCQPGWGEWCGPYYQDSTTTTVQITDGTSNTIAFGEAVGGPVSGAGYLYPTWIGCGGMASAWDLLSPPQFYSYGSNHGGIVQFAFCDGSVHGLRTCGPTPPLGTDQYNAFLAASGMQDGVPYDSSLLGN